MARLKKIDVYLEIGKKQTFAGAIDWPGWCRSGRDEESALQSLFESGARFAGVVQRSRLGFQKPKDASGFVVVERLKGNATTDFGAPAIAPDSDSKPVSPGELRRLESILKASWRALDRLAEKAEGKTLATGPRGGGRPLDKIIGHVLESSAGYLNQVGWKYKLDDTADQDKQYEQTLQASLDALRASARGEIPSKGPRGGVRWTARYFVRRLAWHILDHAWEIEDRIVAE